MDRRHDPGTAGRHWTQARQTPTLLVEPEPDLGLDPRHVSELLEFAVSVDPSASERQRAAVVMIDHDRLAVIERQRQGSTHHVLPGGGIEPGETIQEAATREALEETGLRIGVIGPIAHILRLGDEHRPLQHCLAARAIGGTFGPGSGPEYTDPDRGRGTYRPIKIPLDELANYDCCPTLLVSRLNEPDTVEDLHRRPVLVIEPAPHETTNTHRMRRRTRRRDQWRQRSNAHRGVTE